MEVLRHRLGGRQHTIEGRRAVHGAAGEGTDRLVEASLEQMEVAEQAFLVERRPFDHRPHPEVVAVQLLHGAADRDRMGGGELSDDLEAEHGAGV